MESPASSSETPAVSSCRRKKNFGSGSFVSDLRSHFHEFIFASMDEHRICLVETFKKMKSKFYIEKSATGPNEGEGPRRLPKQLLGRIKPLIFPQSYEYLP
uniref:uncharacterized protein LOC105351097 n=1 Tax=Fragaria vesca subsp. vesca TaxID=101020 RepID=UPI0005C974E9|nr:PREDICTED: uncharacterized protein LOC105351097 [Fragaria vesca subsp. vesca]